MDLVESYFAVQTGGCLVAPSRCVRRRTLHVHSASPTPAESGQSIDASLRADIEKLLEITGSAQMGTQAARLMSGQFLEILRKSDPSIPDRALALVKEGLDADFAMAFSEPGGLTEQLVVMYAKHFSREEVQALLTFYSSDLGRKVIASMPVVFQESAAAGQQWAQKQMPRITKTIETRPGHYVRMVMLRP